MDHNDDEDGMITKTITKTMTMTLEVGQLCRGMPVMKGWPSMYAKAAWHHSSTVIKCPSAVQEE
jgi:hypothetical protein